MGQPLPRQHAQLDLGNIEPRSVLRCVVDLQPVREGFGLFRRKHLIERGWGVRIEVVHYYDHLLNLWIVLLKHLLHEKCPVLLRAVLGDFQKPFASQWLIGNEQIGAALFLITVVFPCDLAWPGWLRGILVFDQILAHLIHADPGHRRVVGLAIDLQHVFHVIDKLPICLLGETPGFFEPGL